MDLLGFCHHTTLPYPMGPGHTDSVSPDGYLLSWPGTIQSPKEPSSSGLALHEGSWLGQ